MKKILSFAIAIVATLAVNAQENVKTTEYFKGDVIEGLICDGTMNIQLDENPSATGVFIEVPDGKASDIIVDMTTENFIRIKLGNDFTKAFKSRITVKVTVTRLKYLKLSGATSVIAKGKFMRAKEVTISLDGSSASADYLDIVADDVKLDVNGTTKFQEATINTENFKLSTSGTGPKVNIVGGKAANAVVATSGAGISSINLVNFPIGKLDATITGLSNVKANIQTKAYVKVANGASFKYMGTGVVEGEGNYKPL